MNKQRYYVVALVLAGALAGGCKATGTHDRSGATSPTNAAALLPTVKMETSFGDIVLELDAGKAPVTVMNFLKYVEAKFYDGTIFHRVNEGYLIQSGGYLPSMEEKTEGVGEPILLETEGGLSNVRGTIAMAHKISPHSATTQFFINVVDNSGRLDYPQPRGSGYAVFGKVVKGMDTVGKIAAVPVGTHPKYAEGRLPVVPVTPVVINSVRLIGSFDRAKAQALADARNAEFARKLAESRKTTEELLREAVKRIEREAKAKFTKTDSGLMYLDHRVGKGPRPTVDDTVVIQCRGTLLNGSEFENTYGQDDPPILQIDGLIKGLREGLTTMNAGGRRTIIVPPELGFGESGVPGKIPYNATIVFEIELLEIK